MGGVRESYVSFDHASYIISTCESAPGHLRWSSAACVHWAMMRTTSLRSRTRTTGSAAVVVAADVGSDADADAAGCGPPPWSPLGAYCCGGDGGDGCCCDDDTVSWCLSLIRH